jgi:hypothetical protein
VSTPRTRTDRPLNVSYLVVGLIFLGIAGSWALHASGVVDTGDVQWLIPLVLVGAGLIGLVAFTAKGLARSRDERVDDEPGLDLYDEAPYAPTDQTDQTDQTDRTMRIEGEDR